MANSGWCLDGVHADCKYKPCTCHCHTPAPAPVVAPEVKARRRKILDKMVEDAEEQGLYDDMVPEENNKEQA